MVEYYIVKNGESLSDIRDICKTQTAARLSIIKNFSKMGDMVIVEGKKNRYTPIEQIGYLSRAKKWVALPLTGKDKGKGYAVRIVSARTGKLGKFLYNE